MWQRQDSGAGPGQDSLGPVCCWGGENMREVELTAQRLLSVWWLAIWRGGVGGVLLGAVAGGIAGFVIGYMGHPEFSAIAGGYASLAVAPFWGVLVLLMTFRKKYKDFRIALIAR